MEYYKNCSELPLRVFFDIANTGDVKLLLVNGEADDDKLQKVWRQILEEYARLDQNPVIGDVMGKNDIMFKMTAEFCEIKGMLLYLIGGFKQEYIDRLEELGYPLDLEDYRSMVRSINKADARSNSIKNKIRRIKSDIDVHTEAASNSDFDTAYVWLAVNLGFEPKEDLTVARYLQYKKQIVQRSRQRNKKSVANG